MSMKKRKGGLVISWQRSISILAPWRKGKGDRDAVLETEVVLTKLKFFSTFQDRVTSSDCETDNSTVSTSEQNRSDLTMVRETDSHLNDNSVSPQLETGPDFLPAVFTNSHLPRLYKFESEDSGVDLPSGANSPSTPMGSEQSFVVHSRESSCHSCNLNSDVTVPPEELVKQAQDCESEDAGNPQDSISIRSVEFCSSVEPHTDKDGEGPAGNTPVEHQEVSEQVEETRVSPEETCPEKNRAEKQSLSETRDDVKGSQPESRRRSTTSESLEEYMEECCRLSQEQPASSGPLGSGLGYLGHICQLLEKIGQLQESNLKLQRQICGLQKDSRMAKAKEDFFHQHCSCGAASLIFQPALKRQSRNEFLSLSGTMSDLSTIPEVSQHPLTANTDSRSEALWRRGLNRRSYTEGEVRFLGDSTEGLSQLPQRRFSDNYNHTWGRVKDLVKRTKVRNPSRLGLVSPSLKMSCPQLYRPDLGPAEPAAHRNRNSMIVLGHQSKTDFPWSP